MTPPNRARPSAKARTAPRPDAPPAPTSAADSPRRTRDRRPSAKAPSALAQRREAELDALAREEAQARARAEAQARAASPVRERATKSVVQEREAELEAAHAEELLRQREAEAARAQAEAERLDAIETPEGGRAAAEVPATQQAPTVADVDEDAVTLAGSVPAPAGEDAPPDRARPAEQRLDELLEEAARAARDPNARPHVAAAFARIAEHLGSAAVLETHEDPSLLHAARDLLSPDYYLRQWGRVALRSRSEDVDEFGLDKAYAEMLRPLLEALHRKWFRVVTRGIEHIPDGRALLVGNHAGALPWDGLMLRTTLELEHPSRRELRWLTEDFVAHTPFLGAITTRLGAVRACPENAERLLGAQKLVAVFPEGEKGLGKPWSKRYEIQRFGRGGFVRLAIRTATPIVPLAIVGSEEAHPLLLRTDRWARWLGVPFVPITPTFPWLGPLGLIPLPSRWIIRFGAPIDLSSELGHHDDPVRVQALAEEVRSAVRALVKQALAERPSAF